MPIIKLKKNIILLEFFFNNAKQILLHKTKRYRRGTRYTKNTNNKTREQNKYITAIFPLKPDT